MVIEIGGQRLRLNANADGKHLEDLARVVNERYQTIQRDTRSAIPATVLALVALQLADEVEDMRRKLDESRDDARKTVAAAESRAKDIEHRARKAVVDAITEIDRTLSLDDELSQKERGRTESETA